MEPQVIGIVYVAFHIAVSIQRKNTAVVSLLCHIPHTQDAKGQVENSQKAEVAYLCLFILTGLLYRAILHTEPVIRMEGIVYRRIQIAVERPTED